VRSVIESGEIGQRKGLTIGAGTMRRRESGSRETIRRLHEGAIGELIACEAIWSGGELWSVDRQPSWSDMEYQLRNWPYYTWLSGDFIVEQSIHSLDVATWIINADPIRARGVGGHKVRPANSIYDHFAVTYWFPDDLVLSFTCIQSIPMIKDEIRARAYGADGFIDVDYFAGVRAEYDRRRNVLYDGLKDIPGVVIRKPEGAFYVIIRLPVKDVEHFAVWLLSDFSLDGKTVMIAPAPGFYSTPSLGTDEARIAYVVNEHDLREAVRVFKAGLERYKAVHG